MKLVYIVLGGISFEGRSLIGVFDSSEKAEAERQRAEREDRYDYVVVDIHEVK